MQTFCGPAVTVSERKLHYVPMQTIHGDDSEIPIRVLKAGICETDLQIVRGYMGFEGVLGHEFVGVAQAGKWQGKRVVAEINFSCRRCEMCLSGLSNHCGNRSVLGILNHHGAFTEQVFAPEECLHVIPESVSDQQAVFVEPLAAAYQISKQVDLNQHPKAVVIGDGRLGYLISQVLRLSGCDVAVVGRHAAKLAKFSRLGFETHFSDALPASRGVSLAVDCTGSLSGIPTALRWLKPRGTLVLKTTIGGETGPNLAAVVIDEINIVGSRCGPFTPAIEALAKGSIEVDSLVTARFALSEPLAAFEAAASGEHFKVLFDVG